LIKLNETELSITHFKHFEYSEFDCKCCHENNISINLVKMLDCARDLTNQKFIINSGYRCEKHNAEINGMPDSSHLIGKAVDIEADNDNEKFEILSALLAIGFKRIGIGKNFIHCDIDNNKPLNVIWCY